MKTVFTKKPGLDIYLFVWISDNGSFSFLTVKFAGGHVSWIARLQIIVVVNYIEIE